MKKHVGMIVLAVLIIGALLIYTITYQVDELRDIVLIETFGKVTSERIGSQDAGLKLKWPWPIQRVIRYDSRVFLFEDTSDEVPTNDVQNLLVTMYCAWRIEQPSKFHRAIGARTADEKVSQARQRVQELLRSKKKDVVGRHNMAEFINTDADEMRLGDMEKEMLKLVRQQALNDYGIRIVRVGIKSLALPQEVTSSVINAMKTERQRAVEQYEAQGEAQAVAIEERAKAAAQQILAFADRKAKEIRSQGDQAAAKYYAKFTEFPELSIFLRRLESLKIILAGKSVFLLDGSELPAIRWLREGPSLSTPATQSGQMKQTVAGPALSAQSAKGKEQR